MEDQNYTTTFSVDQVPQVVFDAVSDEGAPNPKE
jgi:hypothetical protein